MAILLLIPPSLILMPVAAVVVSNLLNYPTREAVEGREEKVLPVGHFYLRFLKYVRKRGSLVFDVKYQNHGDPVGVEFNVQHFPNHLGRYSKTSVVARRAVGLTGTHLAWFQFRDGVLHEKKVDKASAGEVPWLEQTATELDEAVRTAY